MTRLAGALSAAVLAMSASLPFVATAMAADGAAVSGMVRANPLRAELTLPSAAGNTGELLLAVGTLVNVGQPNLQEARIRLRLDSSLTARPNPERTFRSLKAGQTRELRWRLCPTAPGNYILLVEAAATGPDGATYTSSSAAMVLSIEGEPVARCRGGRPPGAGPG